MQHFNTKEPLRALIIRLVRQHRCAVERTELSQPRYQPRAPIRRFHYRPLLLISFDTRVTYLIKSRAAFILKDTALTKTFLNTFK